MHEESWAVFSGVNLAEAREDETLLAALDPYKKQLFQK